MAFIIIPTRIIPGCALGGLFAGIGLTNGLGISLLVVHREFRPVILISIPVLAVAIWFIVHVCRRRSGTGQASRATSLSPSLLAGILIVCLTVGLGTGALASTLIP